MTNAKNHRTGYTVHAMGYRYWHRTEAGALARARRESHWAGGHIHIVRHDGDTTTDHASF